MAQNLLDTQSLLIYNGAIKLICSFHIVIQISLSLFIYTPSCLPDGRVQGMDRMIETEREKEGERERERERKKKKIDL